jgi:hypothetical protein
VCSDPPEPPPDSPDGLGGAENGRYPPESGDPGELEGAGLDGAAGGALLAGGVGAGRGGIGAGRGGGGAAGRGPGAGAGLGAGLGGAAFAGALATFFLGAARLAVFLLARLALLRAVDFFFITRLATFFAFFAFLAFFDFRALAIVCPPASCRALAHRGGRNAHPKAALSGPGLAGLLTPL